MAYQMPGYPVYQQQYPAYQDRLSQLQNQYQQTIPQYQQQPANQGLLWVQGVEGAKSYLVAPNTTVLLMDADAQRFYLKSTDGTGIPNLRMFEYTEVTQNVSQPVLTTNENLDDKYVTRNEYNDLKNQYEEIINKLSSMQNTSSKRSKNEEIRKDEESFI